MKMDPGITGRAIQMTMTDRLWVVIIVAVALVVFNHVAWIGRVEQLREWNGDADGLFLPSE